MTTTSSLLYFLYNFLTSFFLNKDGKQIARDLKELEALIQTSLGTKLAKVSLMSCCGVTHRISDTSLIQDLWKALNHYPLSIKQHKMQMTLSINYSLRLNIGSNP
jgi:G:T-mismatch repair DNA endonuclease (very short patch repair protein)